MNESQQRLQQKRQNKREKLKQLSQKRMEVLPHPPALPFTTLTPSGENKKERIVRRSRLYQAAQWSLLQEYASKLEVSTAALVLTLYARALRQYSDHTDFMVSITSLPIDGTEMELAERTEVYAHRARKLPSLAATVYDTYEDLHYRLLRGIDCDAELQKILKNKNVIHPGISPYIFTYAAHRPIFNNETISIFGQPRIEAQTPQAIIDCQIFRLSDQTVEVAFDVRRSAIAADVEQGIFNLFTESIDTLIEGKEPENTLPQTTHTWRQKINSTAASSPQMLLSGFRQQVQVQPTALAIISPKAQPDLAPELVDPLLTVEKVRQWSYRELDQMARQLAGRLVNYTEPEDIIGIRLAKGPAQIVAVLAVLYAGCAYLPVGLDIPENRLKKIRSRSGMRYLLTVKDFFDLEQQKPLVEPRKSSKASDSDTLAYIIFTSGSTGEPKGVAISHRAAHNTIIDINTRHQVKPGDVLLAISSLDFDLSVYDIFGPLSAGATIVTLHENERRDAFCWAERIRTYQVTLWNSVPALTHMLSATEQKLPSIRIWLCSGDWIPPLLFTNLQKIAPKSVLVALGGSTEASIWSNQYVIQHANDLKAHWPSVPYGLPLSGQRYRVVREEEEKIFSDCPDGVTGELWIGGEGLAQGYIGDLERTAERFIEIKAANNKTERWYRTGDLGYWREGLLFFVGRLDTQVKIQGHRIECGEVEQILKTLPGVKNAVVVPIYQRRTLGAILIGPDPSVLTQLPQLLHRQLPHYMIPTRFLIRDHLMLNLNGKVDRSWAAKELELESEKNNPQLHTDTVSSPFFMDCLTAWQKVLKRQDIGADDNFFALGGNSLATIQVCSLLQEKGIHITVEALFAANTLRTFALHCQHKTVPSVAKLPSKDELLAPFPLTSLQRAYALGADGIPGVSRCDTVFSIIINNAEHYPIEHWQKTLNALIQETPALCLARIETEQQVMAPHPVPIVFLNKNDELSAYLAHAPLNTHSYPPFRLVAVQGDLTQVGLMFNYLTLDALSLIRVVLSLTQRITGVENGYTLENHSTSFFQYAQQQIPHSPSKWDEKLWQPPSLPSIVNLAHSCIKSFTQHLNRQQRLTLEEKAKGQQVTLAALILQAFGQSLLALCDCTKTVIVVPVCWRSPHLPHALGQFTQLRLCRYSNQATITDVFHELAEAIAGKTPDDRYIASRGRAVYPFVFTCLLGTPELEAINQQETRIIWSHTRTPGVVIDCQISLYGDGLEIRWDYAEGIFDSSRLASAYQTFIEHLSLKKEKHNVLTHVDSRPSLNGLSGREIARKAIAAALPAISASKVVEVFMPVFAAWRKQIFSPADAAWQQAGHFLAEYITGRRSGSQLLQHPFLAPEQLLLASLQQLSIFDRLINNLKDEYFSHPTQRSPLKVLILGSDSGAFTQVLMKEAKKRNLPLQVSEYEIDKTLKSLSHYSHQIETVDLDAVISPATLHRDNQFLTYLSRINRKMPVRLHVLEITQADEATLIAALLDPTLVEDKSPLLTSSAWGQQLEQLGIQIDCIQRISNNLVWIKAVLPKGEAIHASPPLLTKSVRETEIGKQVALSWKEVLNLSTLPTPCADFFALGGDSLSATQIVMRLRRQGLGLLRLADLFNHPTLADFIDCILSQRTIAPKKAFMPVNDSINPYLLTALQQAYLIGRSKDQLLGGVASHCYFEFTVSTPGGIDVNRWRAAVNQVVQRHDALRSRIIWQHGRPFAQISSKIADLLEITPDVRTLTEAETPDPTQDYPLRVRLSTDGKTIGLGIDNLMLDGTSMFLVMRELGALYQGKTLPPPPAISYAQYRCSHAKAPIINVPTYTMPPAPHLPWQMPLTEVKIMHFNRSSHDLTKSEWRMLREWAGQQRLTPAALLLAAYALEIAKIAKSKKFSINVTTFDRNIDVPEVDRVVGDFTSLGLVAFSLKLEDLTDNPATQLLTQAIAAQQGLLQMHQEPEALSILRISREIIRQEGNPVAGLFPVVFTSGLGLDNTPHRSDDFGFGQLTYARSQTPQVAIDLQVYDDLKGLHITADYVTALLSKKIVDALVLGVGAQLRQLIVNPTSSTGKDNKISNTIAHIWRQHLSLDDAKPLGNFFQSGGNSLQATRCIRDLQVAIDPAISLRLLLVHPHFNDFCQHVNQLIATKESTKGLATSPISDFEEGIL